MSTYVHTYARRPGRSNRECLSRVQVAAASTYVRTYVRAYVFTCLHAWRTADRPYCSSTHATHARHAYVRTYIVRTYVCTYVRTYVFVVVPARAYVRTYAMECMYVRTYHDHTRWIERIESTPKADYERIELQGAADLYSTSDGRISSDNAQLRKDTYHQS